jgi:ppGpp synthetase/RelA/SpoT-type nucleotidyltranferase
MIKQTMSFNDELRQTIRELKYRMQELDAKTVNDKIDVSDVTARIKEIYGLAEKLEKNWR